MTDVDYFDDEAVSRFVCNPDAGPPDPNPGSAAHAAVGREPEMTAWRRSVEALQQLHRDGSLSHSCSSSTWRRNRASDKDRFHDNGAIEDDEALQAVLGEGVPVASSTRAYLHYRPSQMPGAAGHSVGNANRVKADVLFDFLRTRVLPPLLANRS